MAVGPKPWTDAYRYHPFGVTLAASGSAPNPYRFAGRLLEPTSGQYDFGARSYDPALGAFTSLDTVLGAAANPIGLNRYLYAEANPGSLIDPDGHAACRYGDDCAEIAAAQALASLRRVAASAATAALAAWHGAERAEAAADLARAALSRPCRYGDKDDCAAWRQSLQTAYQRAQSAAVSAWARYRAAQKAADGAWAAVTRAERQLAAIQKRNGGPGTGLGQASALLTPVSNPKARPGPAPGPWMPSGSGSPTSASASKPLPTPGPLAPPQPRPAGPADSAGLHAALDLAGIANPIADGANAYLYAHEGDLGAAVISALSVIPVADVIKVLRAGDRGTSVLGHYPGYLDLAEATGGNVFNIPTSVWRTMSKAEQEAANLGFLQGIVARGDDVLLSVSAKKVRPGSALESELDYLFGKGYTLDPSGWKLIAP